MKYYLIAGEASGDLHASNLMKEILRLDEDADFRYWGGDLMKQQGGTLVKHYRELAFMGFLEVLLNLPTILMNLESCKQDIREFHPDVVILVDYPGFNLRMSKYVKSLHIPVYYYISPQLWAWNSLRVKTIKKYVDKMFVVLPFEKEFYGRYQFPVEFHGHPLLDVINPAMKLAEKESFLKTNNLDGRPIIALLPGSRKQEIKTILKEMLQTIPAFPGHQFVIAGAPSIPVSFYSEIIANCKVSIVFQQTYDLLHHADAALVTSGTATLETALMSVPQVVCYKGNPLSYMIARQVVKVKFISLVNLIMNRMIVSELIQAKLNRNNLITELGKILNDPETRHRIHSDYMDLRLKLGGEGASAKAARKMIQYLTKTEVLK